MKTGIYQTVVALSLLLFTACAGDSETTFDAEGDNMDGPPVAVDANGVPVLRCIDDDRVSWFGFDGPLYDRDTQRLVGTDQDSYIAATTLFHYTAERSVFTETVERIIEAAMEAPGFVGVDIAISEKCQFGRTITVWESEEDEFNFVLSGPHLEAMGNLRSLGDDGRNLNWTISPQEIPVPWETALERISVTLP